MIKQLKFEFKPGMLVRLYPFNIAAAIIGFKNKTAERVEGIDKETWSLLEKEIFVISYIKNDGVDFLYLKGTTEGIISIFSSLRFPFSICYPAFSNTKFLDEFFVEMKETIAKEEPKKRNKVRKYSIDNLIPHNTEEIREIIRNEIRTEETRREVITEEVREEEEIREIITNIDPFIRHQQNITRY